MVMQKNYPGKINPGVKTPNKLLKMNLSMGMVVYDYYQRSYVGYEIIMK